MNNILILGIIFLLPIVFVITKNYFWNISYWQKKSFKFENFIKNYSWDLENINKSLHFLKFLSLSLLSLLFINTLFGSIGIILTYIVYVIDFYNSITNILRFREPKVNILIPKTLLLSILTLLLLTLTIFAFTYPFINFDTSKAISNGLFNIIPDYYLYLGSISFYLLLLDLISPSILIIFRILLLPIDLVNEIVYRLVAKNKLRELENQRLDKKIKVVTIINSEPDNYLQLLLNNILKVKPSLHLSSNDSFYKQIYYLLNNKTKYLILNVDNRRVLNNLKSDYELDLNSKVLVNNLTLGEVNYLDNVIKSKITYNNLTEEIYLPNNPKIYPRITEIINLLINLGYSFNKAIELFNDGVKNHNIFLSGDNNLRIVNFSNIELDAKHLLDRVKYINNIKGNNKIILLTNGFEFNSKEYLELAVSELKNYVDIIITSSKNLHSVCLNEDIECFKVNSFRDFAYLTRLHSKENDFVLLEGHFKSYVLKELVLN